MSDKFPEAIKLSLQGAILAALAREGIDIGKGSTAVVVNSVLGETEIALTAAG